MKCASLKTPWWLLGLLQVITRAWSVWCFVVCLSVYKCGLVHTSAIALNPETAP